MSSTCNGFAITEGRRSFALMPAIVACDNRHAIDPRPLTREQIAAIPGVRFQAKMPEKSATPAPVRIVIPAPKVIPPTPRTTAAERATIITMYKSGCGFAEITRATGRYRSSIREIIKAAKLYRKAAPNRPKGVRK